MKSLRDMFIELLSESELFEQAHDRKNAMSFCRGISNQIIKHFLKVYLFPDSIDYIHWKDEITNWLDEIDELILTQKSKTLSFRDLYKVLYQEPIGHEDAIKILLTKMMHKKRISYIKISNYDKIQSKFEKMYYQLCSDISIDKMENIDYYIEMLQE